MAAHIAICPSSTTQLLSHGGSHARDIEPAWLSRLLTRKSRKSQYLSVLDLEAATSCHADKSTVSPTTALLSEEIAEFKPDPLIPRHSAPLPIPGARNAKSKSKSKSKRRFSFTPRREEATPMIIDKKTESSMQVRRKTSGAVYVPKHAASDFGQVAVPTTYRDSFVFLYNSSRSSDHQQHHRNYKGGVGSDSAAAMSEFQRRRPLAISNSVAPESSTVSFETAPTAATTWSRSGSNRRSRQSLVFMMTEEDDAGEEYAVTDVKDGIKTGERSDIVLVLCDQDGQEARQSSVFTMPDVAPVNDDNKKPTSQSKHHSTLGHNLHVPQPASSISSKHAHRESFSQTRRMSRRQSTGETIHSGTHEHTKGRRDSVMVSLGKRMSEYIKPTTMPVNQTTVLPHISVGRSGV